jgi:hypothetical protein
VEGDASVTALHYMDKAYGSDWSKRIVSQPSPAVQADRLPLSLARDLLFPYTYCAAFVGAIYKQGGWTGVDALYSRIPISTEQVLHPEKYAANEQPVALEQKDLTPKLGTSWFRSYESAFGEFDLYNYLASLLTGDTRAALTAASGWGAGKFSIYSRRASVSPAATVLHITLAWDSEPELLEFRREYSRGLTQLRLPDLHNPPVDTVWSWSGPNEYGLVLWSTSDKRVEIVIGTDLLAVRDALAGSPETPRQHELLGNWSSFLNVWRDAIYFYTVSLASNPRQPSVLSSRAGSYERLGDFDSAFKDLTAVLELEPQFAGHYVRRAELEMKRGNDEAAVADATTALQIWTSNQSTFVTGQALAVRGLAYANLGRIEEAIAEMDMALALMAPNSLQRPLVQQKLEELRRLQP